MAVPKWVVTFIKKTFSQRFTLARATNLSPVGRAIDKMLFDGDDIIFLPKDNVIPVHGGVTDHTETVLPSRIVEYFIEQANYHWIMNKCLCRDASHCRDYPIDLGCLFLGAASMGINPDLGRQVDCSQALDHVQRCREAGLVHLIGRNKLDTIWLGVGPGDKLLTICNCCQCCCLWRMLPQLNPAIGNKVQRMAGVTVSVTDRCVGCGICTKGSCFVNAISLADERALISNACRGCGRCVETCPQGAIEISVAVEGRVAESIERLSKLVDIS